MIFMDRIGLHNLLAAMVIAVLLPNSATAQRGRASQMPQSFTANNITVILSPSTSELVSVVVGLEGGIASGETTNPAIGEFATDLITSSGSGKFNKDALRRFASRTSTSFIGGGDARGVRFEMTSTLANFDKAWEMLAAMVIDPAYDSLEYRTIMGQRVANHRSRWSTPSSYSTIIADSLLRLGHPVLSKSATLGDIESITIPMIREFMQRITERSRMIVVVVGKISPNDLREKLEVFSTLPKGSYRALTIAPIPTPATPRIEVVDRKSPTTYVHGVFAGPSSSDPDFWPLRIGLSYLRAVLFEEIRTRRNLSYAPQSYLGSSLGASYGVVSVSTTRPDSAVGIILHELEKMRSGDIDKKAFEGARQIFTTLFYQGQMSSSGVAQSLYFAQRNTGDWHNALALDDIAKVTPKQAQKALKKYLRSIQFGVVGASADVTREKYLQQP